MQSSSTADTFIEKLRAVRQRFVEGESALNHEALNELEHAIQRLQEMKRNLEESPDYVAAKAEKAQKTHESRVATLRGTIEGHQREVERLLGFPPFDVASNYNNAYNLLPKGHVDREQMMATIGHLQTQIEKLEAEAAKLREADDAHLARMLGGNREQMLRQKEQEIKEYKFQMLCYLMNNTPIDGVAFRAKLAPHLDGLLDAFRELRTLEMA
jgi:hypothetical protein